MNNVDILNLATWFFTFFTIGVSVLPLTFLIFKNLLDKGYIFSKILGIAILSYLVFILGFFHVLEFSRLTVIFSLLLLFAVNYLLLSKKSIRKDFLNTFRSSWKFFIVEEVIFVLALFVWGFIKAHQPDINGLEKFMDFGFINSILRSQYFPPVDIWFTPLPINYYYFGHLVTAVLTKLSGIPSFVTFNLMLSVIFALCFTASFSITLNLIYSLGLRKNLLKFAFFGGFLSALFVTINGNLQTIYAFFNPYAEKAVPFWDLVFSPFTFPNGYWYPNATRFIYNTIHEFPMYSWVVSDLHGHVLDIPFVLLTIALFFSIFSKAIRDGKNNKNLIYMVLTGFLLSIMYMTNAWDGIIYFLLLFFLLLLLLLFRKINLIRVIGSILIVGVSFIIFSLPFNHYFDPFVSGIGVLCSPNFLIEIGKVGPFLFEANHCQTSPWWQLIILYGFFYFMVASFILLISKAKKMFLIDLFVLLLIFTSTILILIPELVYAKDIYPGHFRANTMFKLGYQAFIMLSLSSGYIATRVFVFIKENKVQIKGKVTFSIWLLIFLFCLFLVWSYPFFSIHSYFGKLEKYYGLNGTSYLKNTHSTDYLAINWINKNIDGQPVIIEAQGDSYTDYARVSVNTGLPTVLGWTVHEWLWRGTYQITVPRIEDVKKFYETRDIREAEEIVDRYNISLIYIGVLEHEKYPDLYEEKMEKLGEIIYQNSEVKIYKVN